MWRMLQAQEPDDYVVATGETHTVREFCERSFACAGIELEWYGAGQEESGRCTKMGRTLVRVDPRYLRPAEVDLLLGDATKARTRLNWAPKVTFASLVEMMTWADLRLLPETSGTSAAAGPRPGVRSPLSIKRGPG